jgi:hypothetical protein
MTRATLPPALHPDPATQPQAFVSGPRNNPGPLTITAGPALPHAAFVSRTLLCPGLLTNAAWGRGGGEVRWGGQVGR